MKTTGQVSKYSDINLADMLHIHSLCKLTASLDEGTRSPGPRAIEITGTNIPHGIIVTIAIRYGGKLSPPVGLASVTTTLIREKFLHWNIRNIFF